MTHNADPVGWATEQWQREHPGADLSGLEFNGRLITLRRTLDAHSAAVLAARDLQVWEWDVLSTLWRHRSVPVTMSELGTLLLITPGSVTNRIVRMEDRGLVVRETDPASRRRVLVGLTAQGEQALAAALPDVLDASARLRDALAGIDLAGLNEQLAAIARRLAEHGDPDISGRRRLVSVDHEGRGREER
ncbi:MarR family winged helix-turn-helix transcriptional regulator [Nocardia nova]|uniref:MarR family winged helix-turn-helix transcriptional regulator n=1 Tax=Nocardia nova TaxID=37330 RepID=UPI001892FBC4|nr:MarR family transcriptional regulator [Nocardia nova]MBF6149573.1 MarR family transcriptional regulator [Nocardia nova]